jgi:hypothetical protein
MSEAVGTAAAPYLYPVDSSVTAISVVATPGVRSAGFPLYRKL